MEDFRARCLVPLLINNEQGDRYEKNHAIRSCRNHGPGSVLRCAAETKQETNKKIVVEFYDKAINQKDFAAAEKYLGARYVQHNPAAPDGAEGLKGFIGFLQKSFPQSRSEIKRVFADGDSVILHVHSIREPGTRGRAIVDIFKVENGKIVEHWDVAQEIPEKALNTNGMF